MDLHKLLKIFFSIWIEIFIIVISFKELVRAEESKYEACRPRRCSNSSDVSISYPFYIQEAEVPNYCGHPGFQIGCEDGDPIYKTSKGRFLILSISYENQTIRLRNTQAISSASCFDPPQNFTFDRSSLHFSPFHADLCFYYNCSNNFSVNYTKIRLPCTSSSNLSSYVALVHRDEELDWNRSSCQSLGVSPVQFGGEYNLTINNVDYLKLLKDGFTLYWMAAHNCAKCQTSGGRCGYEQSSRVCFCPDGHYHSTDCSNGKSKLKLKLGLGIGCLLALVMLISIYAVLRRNKQKYGYFLRGNTSSNPSSKSHLECSSTFGFGLPIFTYIELVEATNNFDQGKELGDGGFGIVYYGKLRDGREVAIKRLYQQNYRRLQQFITEVEILTRLHHKNLVTLYGCTSSRSQELLLVYEFISNGTVADHLHGDRAQCGSLTWPIRMSIAIETAAALAYLHASDIIHRDVKTNNILLDDKFSVKVADFGLSRLFPTDVTHISTAPQGTPGYVDPEYHQCYQLTEKSDVYSFGVVLIELVSSLPAVDICRHRHEINLANLAINKIQNCALDELIDPTLGYKSDDEVTRMTDAVTELAFQCLQQEKEMRPSMVDVLEELQRIQRGDCRLENVHDQGEFTDTHTIQRDVPLSSPPKGDQIALLKNNQMPLSPISVTDKWISCSTTPNTSG